MDVERVEAATVVDVVDAVVGFAGATRPGQTIWFRGTRCCRHTLMPSLLRRRGLRPEQVDPLEAALITMYRQRSLPFWPEGYPQTDWEHLFSMQHHGIETRLLDWSENTFFGLWFALESDCPEEHEEPCWPVLWALDPQELNRNSLAHVHEANSRVPILNTVDEDIKPYAPATVEPSPRRIKGAVAMHGTHNSARIAAQRGVFTIAGKDMTPIEQAVDQWSGSGFPILRAIDLKGDVVDMRRQLEVLGFSTSMIYPDLPGLARELAERTRGI